MNKRILIIGGAGFIGSHLKKRLLDLEYKVKIADKGDKLNFDDIDIVYHLAGAINLRRGGDSGVERARIICDLCKKSKVKKIIFFSSGGAIYSNPKSEYARANLEIEKIIQESGLDYVILRLSNVYGPGQWEEGIIPQIIKGDLKIKGDGNQTRDFIYISDVVEVAIIAMDKEGVYNVGSGKIYTINQVIDLIKEITGSKINLLYDGEKEISAEILNIEKTKKDFNWKPKINLKEGLVKTIEWKSGK